MSEIQVKLTSSTGIIDQDLELELADQYTIKQILEYLNAENLINTTDIDVQNSKGQPISHNLTLKNLQTEKGKIVIKLQKKGKGNNIPPPPPIQNNFVQPIKERNDSRIEASGLIDLGIDNSQDTKITNFLQNISKEVPKPKQQVPKSNQRPVQKRQNTKVVQGPEISGGKDELKINIDFTDGIDTKIFSVKANYTDSFNDFKIKLDKHIQTNNLADYWQDGEQVQITYNNKPFIKVKMPFSTLNIAKDNQIRFKITRLYPGGAY